MSARILLLSPPSISSHPELLDQVLSSHDRNLTDMQMLDRLCLGLVSLPPSTYDAILILSDADSSRIESSRLLTREIVGLLATSLKPGGILQSQDGTFASPDRGEERREAILAGLVVGGDGAKKPESTATSIPLRFGKSKAEGGPAATTTAIGTGADTDPLSANVKRTNGVINGHSTTAATAVAPAGVGFVDFSDDLDMPVELGGVDSDDDLIDEDTLLTEEDLIRPIQQRTLSIIFLPLTPELCSSSTLPQIRHLLTASSSLPPPCLRGLD